MYTLTLAQGAEGVSVGKPEHVSGVYRQKRKEFRLSPPFSRQCLSVTLKLEVTRAAEEFFYKAETSRKGKSPILCKVLHHTLFDLFNLMKAFTLGCMRTLKLKMHCIKNALEYFLPQNLYKHLPILSYVIKAFKQQPLNIWDE